MGEVVDHQPFWDRFASKWGRLPWGLSWRRDVALPVVVGVLQIAGGVGSAWHHQHHQVDVGAINWVLLMVGPLALVARRRHPVAVLWVTFAATLGSSGQWAGYLSLIVAFFTAATGGHRRAAWSVVVVGYVCSNWLGPLVYGQPVASLDQALLLAAWLLVLVVVAEIRRMYLENLAKARAAQANSRANGSASEERLRMARDLHDVIGHNISLINVQASVGLDLMDSQPEQARASLRHQDGVQGGAGRAARRCWWHCASRARTRRGAVGGAGLGGCRGWRPDRAAGLPVQHRGDRRAAPAAARDRPGRLPDHPGVADERHQARPRVPRRGAPRLRPATAWTSRSPTTAGRPRHRDGNGQEGRPPAARESGGCVNGLPRSAAVWRLAPVPAAASP